MYFGFLYVHAVLYAVFVMRELNFCAPLDS